MHACHNDFRLPVRAWWVLRPQPHGVASRAAAARLPPTLGPSQPIQIRTCILPLTNSGAGGYCCCPPSVPVQPVPVARGKAAALPIQYHPSHITHHTPRTHMQAQEVTAPAAAKPVQPVPVEDVETVQLLMYLAGLAERVEAVQVCDGGRMGGGRGTLGSHCCTPVQCSNPASPPIPLSPCHRRPRSWGSTASPWSPPA